MAGKHGSWLELLPCEVFPDVRGAQAVFLDHRSIIFFWGEFQKDALEILMLMLVLGKSCNIVFMLWWCMVLCWGVWMKWKVRLHGLFGWGWVAWACHVCALLGHVMFWMFALWMHVCLCLDCMGCLSMWCICNAWTCHVLDACACQFSVHSYCSGRLKLWWVMSCLWLRPLYYSQTIMVAVLSESRLHARVPWPLCCLNVSKTRFAWKNWPALRAVTTSNKGKIRRGQCRMRDWNFESQTEFSYDTEG